MRLMAIGGAFFAQTQALMHAEAMLFVDDDQAERGEFDPLLKQGMRADDDGRVSFANPFQHGAAGFAGLSPPWEPDGHTQGFEPPPKRPRMLFHQTPRRR